MTHARTALLPDRGVVRVAGEDAGKLLQDIVTNDMDLLAGQSAIHAALLTPQGKILFEFLVIKGNDGFLLDTARDQVPGLVKRLTMYKLRAKVDIRNISAEHSVLATWGVPSPIGGEALPASTFIDPRLPELGLRMLGDATMAAANTSDASADDYHAHRISLCVPEGGKDYVLGDTFPHEANLDLLNGVSFSKGCFVGQEVVSRIQHRGTARKRIVIVEGDQPLQTGSQIAAGQAIIGTVGSVSANRALALVRLDRAEEAEQTGEALTAGGARITLRLPGYFKSPVAASAQ